jgi:hypothetical protein
MSVLKTDMSECWQKGAGATKGQQIEQEEGRSTIDQSSSKIQGHRSANYPA